jgi:galactokinase
MSSRPSFQTGINHFLEGQIPLKLGLAATAVICALSATAQADCVKVEALGEGLA